MEDCKDSSIEIRCVKLDSRGAKILGENTFPDSYSLRNSQNKVIYQGNRLDVNSSLKKRKDVSLSIKYEYFKSFALSKEKLFLTCNNHFDNKSSKIIDKGKIVYVFMLV